MARHSERDLPIDPDVDAVGAVAQRPVPVHLRWASIGVVAVGGAIGTAGREGVSLLLAGAGAWPMATFAVNLVGALFLGVFLEALVRSGPDVGSRLRARLLVGTGFAGGFTTYSAFATEIAEMSLRGDWLLGAGYGLATLVGGGAATILGIALGARWGRR